MSEPLGIHTKFSSTKGRNSEERCIKYYLQSLSRELLPDERVRICLRHRLPGKETIDVFYNSTLARARYGGLMRCGSVWQCPVCSSAISERRREELQTAFNNTRKRYLRLLVTYTARHRGGDSLSRTLLGLTEAYKLFKGGRHGLFLKSEMGQIGAIRATEITFGNNNGWHPHFHELAVFDWEALGDVTPSELSESLRSHCSARWQVCLEKSGLNGIANIAYNVSGGAHDVDEYVAKFGQLPLDGVWGQSSELTRHQSKRAITNDGKTPFELLSDYGNGDKKAGKLFIEYAIATKGRKQLFWSQGLRSLLGIDEIEDSEACAEEEESDILLASIGIDDWRLILKSNTRAEILNIASIGDVSALWRFIGQLREEVDMSDTSGAVIDEL